MRAVEASQQRIDDHAKILRMSQYPKIQTLWERESEKPHDMIVGQFSRPEFEFLSQVPWLATEKIDGTNIRVIWDGQKIGFAGRTDRADIPPFLLESLWARFGGEAVEQLFEQTFGDVEVVLYGEGYGARIQKGGGNYNPDGTDFVLFDVRIEGYWLEHQVLGLNMRVRDTVISIGEKLDCPVVPVAMVDVPWAISDAVARGFNSQWGEFQAEGVVMKPAVSLLTRDGNRVISKLKHKDFEKLNA